VIVAGVDVDRSTARDAQPDVAPIPRARTHLAVEPGRTAGGYLVPVATGGPVPTPGAAHSGSTPPRRARAHVTDRDALARPALLALRTAPCAPEGLGTIARLRIDEGTVGATAVENRIGGPASRRAGEHDGQAESVHGVFEPSSQDSELYHAGLIGFEGV
jgi:hypothetical protein